jgi:hypothetical protein
LVNSQEEALRYSYLVNRLLILLGVLVVATHSEASRRDEGEGHRHIAGKKQSLLWYAWLDTLSDQLCDPRVPLRPFWVVFGFAAGGQQLSVQAEQFASPRVVVLLKPIGDDQPASFLHWVRHNPRE